MLSPVDEIKSRLDIVEIVQEYVQLKPAGANMKGLCPFHREKTPSFTVHRGRQMWYCFGCNSGGDLFTFIQKIENVEFPEALELLAKKANVELKREDPRLRSERQRMKTLLSLAAQWFVGELRGQNGMEALQYLKERRQLTDKTIDEWQLGFAPDAWGKLSRYLRAKGYSDQEIVAAGMAIVSRERGVVYDRFRDRIMFPIRDAHGTTVGFTGRQLHEDKEAGGKYVNTTETLLYHKGSILFGFDKAKQAIREMGYALIVEGQMDVISLWQAGFQHAVAVSGTALTVDQLRFLKRVTDTLVLCFDADPGGSSSASRGVELAWAEGFEVKVVALPIGVAKDPDELVRKDRKLWVRALQECQPILEYLFARARREHPGQTVEEKKAVARALLPALVRLADPIEQDHYIKRLSEDLAVSELSLREALSKARQQKTANSYKRIQPAAPTVASPEGLPLLDQLFSLIITSPAVSEYVFPLLTPEEVHEPYQGLYKDMTVWYSTSTTRTSQDLMSFIEAANPQALPLAYTLLLKGEERWQASSEAELMKEGSRLARLWKRSVLKKRLDALVQQMKEAERASSLSVSAQEERTRMLKRLTEEFNQYAAALAELEG